MRNIGFLGRWGTYACPQCLPSDIVPIRSWTRTLRPPGIRHRHLPYHTIPWVCYRRRNQWLRLALALFCLPLIWLACVVYLLVCVAEGWDGRRGCVYPCVVLGYVMLRYSVGDGVGVMRVSGRCFVALLARRVFMKIVNHVWDRWLWRGRCLVVL